MGDYLVIEKHQPQMSYEGKFKRCTVRWTSVLTVRRLKLLFFNLIKAWCKGQKVLLAFCTTPVSYLRHALSLNHYFDWKQADVQKS